MQIWITQNVDMMGVIVVTIPILVGMNLARPDVAIPIPIGINGAGILRIKMLHVLAWTHVIVASMRIITSCMTMANVTMNWIILNVAMMVVIVVTILAILHGLQIDFVTKDWIPLNVDTMVVIAVTIKVRCGIGIARIALAMKPNNEDPK